MSDEQRKRKQFEEWVSGAGYNATRYGDGPFDRYHAVEVNAMWDGYRARDAEVQALREELLNYVSADEMAGGEGYGTYPNSEHRRIRALVAGEEGNNHE